jgi:hypothetical protein
MLRDECRDVVLYSIDMHVLHASIQEAISLENPAFSDSLPAQPIVEYWI